MTNDEIITIELDLKPINPKKQRAQPEPKDLANSYTIAITRSDGKGLSEDEAGEIMFAWLLNRNHAKRRRTAK